MVFRTSKGHANSLSAGLAARYRTNFDLAAEPLRIGANEAVPQLFC
jgi:hypothetical protein